MQARDRLLDSTVRRNLGFNVPEQMQGQRLFAECSCSEHLRGGGRAGGRSWMSKGSRRGQPRV